MGFTSPWMWSARSREPEIYVGAVFPVLSLVRDPHTPDRTSLIDLVVVVGVNGEGESLTQSKWGKVGVGVG